MEILQLKYFYALAQTQHVTKTAEQLHIAQPALTQTIHRLEKELGVKLFESKGRNIVLTEYGRYLEKRIEPVLKALNDIPNELQILAGERKKLLKINVKAASGLVTDTIIRFQKEHSELRFQITQNAETEDADITIFTQESFKMPQNSKDKFYIFSERIFLAVPKNSEYEAYDSITLSEVSDKKFISLTGAKNLRAICDNCCMHAGFKPDVIFEGDSTSAVENLIAAGLGVGFWPHYTWERYLEGAMKLLPISEPECHRDIVIRLHSNSLEHEEAVEYFKYLSAFFDKLKEERHKRGLL
ncbi:MAG: LysR family transcriptional regulator [Lachnospiraceae bacterium]|nr:LysR family transcriptional regulator [Lachnospiraceae bacterium]